MTDREMLEEVHKMARTHIDRATNESVHNHTARLIASFIEEEWQKRDEKDAKVAADEMIEAADEVFGGASLDERHCKLVIREDGTVTEIERLR
jgi:hypothetical protein